MVRLLVTGPRGQLGRDVVAAATAAGDEVVATDSRHLDVTDRGRRARSDHVGPAARRRQLRGLEEVDACESDPDKAFSANALVGALARRGL